MKHRNGNWVLIVSCFRLVRPVHGRTNVCIDWRRGSKNHAFGTLMSSGQPAQSTEGQVSFFYLPLRALAVSPLGL